MVTTIRVLCALWMLVGLAGLAAVFVPGDQTRDLPVGLALFAMGTSFVVSGLALTSDLGP